MPHPQSCTDPDCTLTYREHLLSVQVAAMATPTRNAEVVATEVRERRWTRDHDAFERLAKNGLEAPHLDGARARELNARTPEDITHGTVKVDYSDPT